MTLDSFQGLVQQNLDLFIDAPVEVEASIAQSEARVGIRFPESLRWLLLVHGYADASGIDSLSLSADATLRCRQKLGLPQRYLVLNDWGDVGVVIMDTDGKDPETWPVHWCGAHNVRRLAQAQDLDSDCDSYPGFTEWVASRIVEARERKE